MPSDRRSSCGSAATCASTDHPALCAAAADGATSCLCSSTTRRSTAPGRGVVAYLRAALHTLNESIGGALVIRRGDPVDVVPAVAAEVGAPVRCT